MQFTYLNGRYHHKNDCKISTEDRGYNFSDGVYEVISFKNKILLNYERHLVRLKKSLSSLNFESPFYNFFSLKIILMNLIDINLIGDGFIYLQITRGNAPRNHLIPKKIKPNIFLSIYPKKNLKTLIAKGVNVITSNDLRWKRCDIKSISLLPNVLGKQMAYNEGTYELWQTYDKDIISEGTTSNAFIVKDQNIFTHPQNHCILGGITRDIVIKIAREKKINILEKKFSLGEVYNSDEAFLTSTTVGVLPVVKINNKYILNGKIGKITKKIRIFYEDFINNQLKKHE